MHLMNQRRWQSDRDPSSHSHSCRPIWIRISKNSLQKTVTKYLPKIHQSYSDPTLNLQNINTVSTQEKFSWASYQITCCLSSSCTTSPVPTKPNLCHMTTENVLFWCHFTPFHYSIEPFFPHVLGFQTIPVVSPLYQCLPNQFHMTIKI